MSKWTPQKKEFHNAIRKILWEKWDPIGVYEPGATWDDEYDSYAGNVFSLAIEGKDAIKIASYLSSSAKQSMGLSESSEPLKHDLRIAEIIINTKKEILG